MVQNRYFRRMPISRKFHALTVVLCLSVGMGVVGVITGCPWYRSYDPLTIMPGVVNLRQINTVYNEYNAAAPPFYTANGYFLFSTDVGSTGDDFDIWLGYCSLDLSGEDGPVDMENTPPINYKVSPIGGAASSAGTNEFGPFLYYDAASTEFLPDGDVLGWSALTGYSGTYELIYASDTTGDGLDLYLLNDSNVGEAMNINIPGADDGYLCYDDTLGIAVFSSNRDGNFNIYSVNTTSEFAFPGSLTEAGTAREVTPVSVLNSEFDETCPYIFENIVVFVSNRRDGTTFDTYYSVFGEGGWGAPSLFPDLYTAVIDGEYSGPMISAEAETTFVVNSEGLPAALQMNTPFNEYRPVLFRGMDNAGLMTDPYVMLFSSDRPCGYGGFDLYLALIPGELLE